MKRIISTVRVIAVAMLLIATCGCDGLSSQPEPYEITAQSLCSQLNEKRTELISEPLEHTITDYGTVDIGCAEEFTNREVTELVTPHNYKSDITLEEAIDDTDTLMRIFKTSYGAYGYFGGDSAFLAAQQRINDRLTQAYADGSGSTEMLHSIILEELAFVEDSHLRIGGKCTDFKEKLIYFESTGMTFLQDVNGFFTLLDGERYYLDKADETLIHLTVDDNGKLVYGLFMLSDDESTLPADITLTCHDGSKDTVNLYWKAASAGSADRRVHNYSVIDGIPVTSLSRMSINRGDISLTNDFINETAQLKDEKVFILDLRSNNGGSIYINDFFMYGLTGSRCQFKSQTVKRYSSLNLHHDKVNNDYMGGSDNYASFEQIDFFKNNRELVRSWYISDSTVPQSGETITKDVSAVMTPYKNTIIVLIDKNTVSAGEYFLHEFSTVENVIIMGTNSAGCLITGDVNTLSSVYLPNSGISVTYGQVLMLNDYADGFDSSGFMPDVISRNDALADAVALAKTL